MNNYDDIINYEYKGSNRPNKMSIEMRSAQFAPFSALVGYEEAIAEKARLTDKQIIKDENLNEILDNQLQYIQNNINNNLTIKIKYFVKDKLKQGGKYQIETNKIKKIDYYQKLLIMENNKKIPINNIIDIKIL